MTLLRVRPTAETFALDDLVELARRGALRVPAFQRGLRWTRRDVLMLFDSIVNGYPVGSLLLWERDAPAEAVTLGPLVIDARAGQCLYVVDGQQRITALAAALTQEGQADPRFAIGYDLDDDAFVARPQHDDLAWVPAHVLYDLGTLLQWFRDRPELAGGFEAAARVSKALRDLKLPAYVVRGDDEDVLRAIFDRMNNAGKKLTRGEVFSALHRAGGGRSGAELEDVAEEIEARTSFGLFHQSLVMKLVLARRGPDVMREIRNEFDASAQGRDEFAAREAREEAFASTADAAVRAIEFLQRVAAVPHRSFVPYEHLFVALTRFFAHHPHPTPRHERLLRRFFWRAVVLGPGLTRGDTTGVGRLLNRAVLPGDEVASITGLVAAVDLPRTAYPPVDPFRTNSAATKALLCALWNHGPRGIATGAPVVGEELRTALGESPTAIDVVDRLVSGRAASGHERDAGNRILLVLEVDRESRPLDVLAGAPANVLASHLLDEQDVADLRSSSAATVLARRAGRLSALQQSFLDQVCEWDQEDSPDLTLLLAAQEGGHAPV